MHVASALFGELTVPDDEVIEFPQGLPGFPEYRQFVMIRPDPEILVTYLQSVDEGNISFVLVDPFQYYPHYEFKLDEADKEFLGISKPEDVTVYSIVTVKESIQDATLNLLAPLVIHMKKKRGKQIVLHGSEYSTKHPLLPQESSSVKEGK